MSSINSVSITGRLTKDVDLKTTQSGKTVTNITLAVDNFGKDAGASFIDVVLWGATAEIADKYLSKGSMAGITGRLQQRSYEDRDGNKRSIIEVVASDLVLLTPRSESSQDKPMTQAQALNGGKDFAPTDIDDSPVDLSAIPF